MALRLPNETVEQTTQSLPPGTLNLDWLADFVREANQPLPISDLARESIRASLVEDSQLRLYVPGCHYRRGERLRLLDGRVGDVVSVESGGNATQGTFNVIWVRVREGEMLRLASEVPGGPSRIEPSEVRDEIVDQLMAGQESAMIRRVRQALASDPRFITLYYSDGEYASLREFFPPMSPDVLDAALALLLDALFDQVPITRITAAPTAARARPLAAISSETLFSVEHLDGAVATNPEWDEAAQTAFEAARALWGRVVHQGDAWDDEQMARFFVHPLLRVLGWSVFPLPEPDSSSDGLYALCRDEAAASGLYMSCEPGADLTPWVMALGKVARWGQPLDRQSSEGAPASGEKRSEAPPPNVAGHQLVGALRRTEVRWGLLTNGQVWRVFSRDANSLSRVFHEVDLATVFDGLEAHELPDSARWDVFRRWFILFRQASYLSGKDGACLIERLRQRSPQGELKVQEFLRERLLTTVLPAIAGGFLTYRRERTGIREETPATLRTVYRASVELISRMLFVLIAEARGLLPMANPDYLPHSLTGQARWAVDRVRWDLPLSTNIYTTPRYELVLALLHRISRGDAEKGLPCYGRQFFDPSEREEHAFLEQVHLSDEAMAIALDGLTRDLSYSLLNARDLVGACAELMGLELEARDAGDAKLSVTVQFDEAVWRRSALPDYVVTSSVEQALAPVLERRGGRFNAAMDNVVDLRGRLRRALDRRQRAALYAEWEAAVRTARDAFFGLHVCDPAMGTGDFLLSAVDVLTDGIIERLQVYHTAHPSVPREWNPIYILIDEVREDVRNELERYDTRFDHSQLDDASILARLVAQRCLFGVADSPMAAEMAKVGLWLHTFTQGAPLSFLDHRLRWGNPLLGADVERLGERIDTVAFKHDVGAAVGSMYPLTERVDTTPLDLRWSAGQYRKVQEMLEPRRLLLDLAVSAALGDAEAAASLRSMRAAPNLAASAGEVAPTWIKAQAEAEGFFHWPLEFPELFIDLARGSWLEAPAIDLVVGNPPHVAGADTASNDVLDRFYEYRFAEDGETAFNIHHTYLALARRLVGPSGGRTAYVLSRAWLASAVGGI
jgi:hypothetical protein